MSPAKSPSPKPGLVVVTGAAGLIGSAVAWALNRRGQENLLLVDRLDSSTKWRHLAPLRFTDYIEADSFAELLEKSPAHFGNIHSVFHLGACSSTTERDAAYLIRNNFEFTKAVCAGR